MTTNEYVSLAIDVISRGYAIQEPICNIEDFSYIYEKLEQYFGDGLVNCGCEKIFSCTQKKRNELGIPSLNEIYYL